MPTPEQRISNLEDRVARLERSLARTHLDKQHDRELRAKVDGIAGEVTANVAAVAKVSGDVAKLTPVKVDPVPDPKAIGA